MFKSLWKDYNKSGINKQEYSSWLVRVAILMPNIFYNSLLFLLVHDQFITNKLRLNISINVFVKDKCAKASETNV